MSTLVFSYIVISYNRPTDTQLVVNNILSLHHLPEHAYEIIVINNGSPKSYAEFEDFLQQLPATQRALIRYIAHPENLGVARGRNMGINLAEAPFLVFIDDDALFQETNVPALILQKFEQYAPQKIGILACREWRTTTGEYYIATKNKTRAQEREFLTNFFVGSGHVIKKEVFECVGLYPTHFFYGMEEYDLAYKTIAAHYSIVYTADITVLHQKSPDGREAAITLTRWNLENKTVVAYTYLPLPYVATHFLAWSAYLLYQSRGNLILWWQACRNIIAKIRNTKRTPLPTAAIQYIKSVQGRLWY